MNQMENNNNSSNSLVFGRWLQTKTDLRQDTVLPACFINSRQVHSDVKPSVLQLVGALSGLIGPEVEDDLEAILRIFKDASLEHQVQVSLFPPQSVVLR